MTRLTPSGETAGLADAGDAPKRDNYNALALLKGVSGRASIMRGPLRK